MAAVRAAFGEFTCLLDLCRKVDRRLVRRHDIQLLIEARRVRFHRLSRAQLCAAELQYTSLADLLRSVEGDQPVWGRSRTTWPRAQSVCCRRPSGHQKRSPPTSVPTWVF